MRKNKNCLILIVDDNPDELRLLGHLLKDLGEIIFATSAESAYHVACHRLPDLILSDVILGKMSGLDLCQRLKRRKETRDISVILVTAQDTEQTEIAALESGAADYITKPYSGQIVRARVKTHLNVLRHKNLLRLLADKDGLTEVYNRRYFENQGRIELKRHYRQQQPLTLALLDIDHFKSFNDAYGHLQGDVCLREVAQSICANTRRPGEFVSRYGGEEFAMILPNTNTHNAKKYGQWICEQISSLAIPHGHSPTMPFVTASVGLVTVIPSSRTSLENLITTADSALYLAKESGRNQFKVATIEHEVIREAG